MKRCFSCFKESNEGLDICPFCGDKLTDKPKEPIHLQPGTVLAERYIIGRAVGSGGFGIIYNAWDTKLEIIVAVKEFFATRLVTRAAKTKNVIINKKSQAEFEYRKARFLAEARNMAKFGAHKSIPNVFEFFEENGTAYIVMELLHGMGMNEYLRKNKKADIDFTIMVANEVGNALKSMHDIGIIHRDVAPDNIYINSEKDLSIKLLDLGAAKLTDAEEDVVDIILKPGYSPVEQYDNTMSIGPWTDIYALGASVYVMLTGIKPDESTNRKIADTLIPPHEIDPEIPENISNTVMKAMAIDRHMRFKSIPEFLKALNGEKKVVSLAKEKKQRQNKRIVSVVASLLVAVIMGTAVYNIYDSKKSAEVLNPAKIDVWFSVADGSNEETAMNEIVADFNKNYPDVTINLKAIPESEYSSEIEKASAQNSLPTLFESDNIDVESLANVKDLSDILKTSQANNCYFLKAYTETKKVPLAIEVPTAFVITNGATAIKYDNEYFASLSDFGKDTKIAVHSSHKDLISANFDTQKTVGEAEFLNSENNTAAVMLSSSMSFNEVRENLIGYQKTYVFPNTDEIKCNFIYEWSISEGDKDQNKAGETLLTWMLGHSYQTKLMISNCNDGQIPINKDSFNEKISQNNLVSIKDIYNNFIFE